LFNFDKSVEMLQSEMRNSRSLYDGALGQGRLGTARHDGFVGDHVLLCEANPKNVALLYDLVSDFVRRMEADMGYSPGYVTKSSMKHLALRMKSSERLV
jgi:hypothetical protein